ncbi:ribonuclease P protein component, partial [Patescibacteria group bacterium]|nr:ribonuclease P protein component [Patescibacteria group bacterium]MBU1966783.1 ribonuclease P protein component [Patescibacteria group bacterium]
MIPTKHRLNLRHHPEFFNYAKRHYNIFFVVFYQCFSQDRESKLAVIVPKKNINKRVWRNKIKRQVYHLALPLLQKTPGLAMAVV